MAMATEPQQQSGRVSILALARRRFPAVADNSAQEREGYVNYARNKV